CPCRFLRRRRWRICEARYRGLALNLPRLAGKNVSVRRNCCAKKLRTSPLRATSEGGRLVFPAKAAGRRCAIPGDAAPNHERECFECAGIPRQWSRGKFDLAARSFRERSSGDRRERILMKPDSPGPCR